MTKFSVDYFINMFESIPEQNWIVGELRREEKACALGHLRSPMLRREEDAIGSVEAQDLVGMILHHLEKHHNVNIEDVERYNNYIGNGPLASVIIPSLNDSGIVSGISEKGNVYTAYRSEECTPRERILGILREIKAECQKKKEVENEVQR